MISSLLSAILFGRALMPTQSHVIYAVCKNTIFFFNEYCKYTALLHIRLLSCFPISMVLAYWTLDISKTEKIHTFKGLSVKLIWYDCSDRVWNINWKTAYLHIQYYSNWINVQSSDAETVLVRDDLVVVQVDVEYPQQMHQTF